VFAVHGVEGAGSAAARSERERLARLVPGSDVSPISGTVSSIATGGSMVPITVRIDFNKTNKDPGNVIPGILDVNGSVFIAIGYDRRSPTYRYAIRSFSPLITQFDKPAIPDFHGTGGGGGTPTPMPTPTLKPCTP
jgi:hypothetical protein